MKICALILAAGSSSRLGRPKQLVKAHGKTLLERAAESAIEAGLEPVHVVLGACFDQINTSIAHLGVHICKNEQWQEGIGSSISAGMNSVTAEKEYEGVLTMLCDQLHVNSAHLKTLINAFLKEEKGIIATEYANQPGVPALFSRKYFSLLQKLKGDEGAKKIIRRNPEDVHSILFEEAIRDIDTQEDLTEEGLT